MGIHNARVWTEASAGLIKAAEQRFWKALGNNAANVAYRLTNDEGPEFLARLAIFASNGGFEPSASQRRAREIMGKNMFGIEDAMSCFDADPVASEEEVAVLRRVPFSEATLEACKDTHLLVAVFPISIVEIERQLRKEGEYRGVFSRQRHFLWRSPAEFMTNAGEAGWHLVRKKRINRLSPDEKVPTARTMVYAVVGHILVHRGEVPMPVRTSMRCSDSLGNGDYACVSTWDFGEFDVITDDSTHGLASEKRPQI